MQKARWSNTNPLNQKHSKVKVPLPDKKVYFQGIEQSEILILRQKTLESGKKDYADLTTERLYNPAIQTHNSINRM